MSEKPEESQLSNQQKTTERTLRDELLKTLNERFSMSDLKTLVFKLSAIDDEIDFENIEGTTKLEKVRQLVRYMERRRKLPALEKAIEHELTIPRRVSRWFHQGQNIFIVSIVGIIAVTIVALVISPFLEPQGLSTTGIPPTASSIPKPTHPPPPPPQVTLHSFEACRSNFYQDFEDKLSIISDLEILPPGETTSLEINGRCHDQEIILSFTIHEIAPVFLQVATPDSITMTLPDNTDLQILGQLGRAFIYYTDNQFKNAYKTFSEVEKTLPLPKDIYLLMANSQLLSYEYEQAIIRYQTLLAQQNDVFI